MDFERELQRDALHWLLGSLCGVFRIPFDSRLIDQNHPPPTTLATFHEAARALGLKTGSRAVAGGDWTKLPYREKIGRLRPKRKELSSRK